MTPILTKDGEQRDIEWYDAPLTAADVRLIGLLCSGQDVTELRELELHILGVAIEEQRRIGADLHDGVGQELTGLTMIADTLSIALKCTDNIVVLRIADDGHGLESESQSGMGLRTMRYRARLINADLMIARLASGGTEVVCKLPL